eukprot:5073959-Amphidinium_carterae.1
MNRTGWGTVTGISMPLQAGPANPPQPNSPLTLHHGRPIRKHPPCNDKTMSALQASKTLKTLQVEPAHESDASSCKLPTVPGAKQARLDPPLAYAKQSCAQGKHWSKSILLLHAACFRKR